MIVVDAGDFFGNRVPADQKTRSKVVVDYMRTVNYDVVTIGEAELNYGLNFLLEQIKQGKLNVVCANLYRSTDSMLVFKPYDIKKTGGVRIGFIGVIDHDRRKVGVFQELEKLYVTSYVEAIRRYLDEVKSKSDIVVALAHIGLANAKDLAKEIPELDVIIVGHGGDRTAIPQKEGNTIIMKAGSKSSSIATLVLGLDKDNSIVGFDGKNYTLHIVGRVNPVVERLVKSCEERLEQREKLLAKRTPKLPTIPRVAGVLKDEAYLGWQTCKLCHPSIYERWANTPHAKAFAVLAEDDKWSDALCLSCHTTGYEIESQRDSTDIRPEMWNVQCEACHGVGTKHRRDGGMRAIAESVCLRCHTPEWSPHWNYKEALKKIDHGKNEVSN